MKIEPKQIKVRDVLIAMLTMVMTVSLPMGAGLQFVHPINVNLSMTMSRQKPLFKQC